MFSNPDLNGKVPLRVQPEVGEWGPLQVTTARTRSRHRALMPLLFLTIVCGLVRLGWHFFVELQTGEMSPVAAVIVNIGQYALPALLAISLALTIIVWIKGDPTVKAG